MTIQEQVNFWTTPSVLGFYQSCEITVCCLLDHSGKAHNLFTIAVFESRVLEQCPPAVYLTNRKERFGHGMRLIVQQYHISVRDAILMCGQVRPDCNQLTLESGKLSVSQLTPAPSMFVPMDSTLTVPLNRVLKNNFCGGSMVAEWFGDKSDIQSLLSEKELQRAALRIRELVPIDIFTLSDRIGNVIFQCPAQIAFCELSGSEHDTQITVYFDDRVQNTDQYLLSVMTDHDKTLMGFRMSRAKQRDALTATVESTGGPYVISVTDTRHGIPVLHQTTSTIRTVNYELTFEGNEDSVRTVVLLDGDIKRVQTHSSECKVIGRAEHFWKGTVNQRRYQKRMDELAHNREFIRYGKGSNDRQLALEDLRKLMDVRSDTRVCLWDPYLSAKDLLETWYYTSTRGLELRAITSSVLAKPTLNDWREEQRKILSSGSNQLGINLHWRVQHDMFGFTFHDRFLIQLPHGETPRVWSLGISVNGLGKSHHIMQLVSNPGYVVDAFEELWDALEDPSCQLWNSKEEHGYK